MSNVKNVKQEISFIQRKLDILRRILGIQTKIEKLQLELKVREICKEEGLSQLQEDEMIATIYCESGMNPKATCKNDNGTVDYGLCQFNSYWYIGPEKEIKTPQEALDNPTKCARIMARNWVKGRKSDWICYRTGKYISYL